MVKFSIIVTVDMGKLKTVPKQAHWICFLLKIAWITPIVLAVKISIQIVFVMAECIANR